MTDEESLPKLGSVGKPIFHSKMRLVNPETGQDVPACQDGELRIWGPHVCTGYWRNPEASAEALWYDPVDGSGPWFCTGDSFRMDEDGFFTIIGRYKDMIKSGGENIYAAEVEAVFREHPAVADAALIGMPHETWGEVGLMVVVLEAGGDHDGRRTEGSVRRAPGPLQDPQNGGLCRRAALFIVREGAQSRATEAVRAIIVSFKKGGFGCVVWQSRTHATLTSPGFLKRCG